MEDGGSVCNECWIVIVEIRSGSNYKVKRKLCGCEGNV